VLYYIYLYLMFYLPFSIWADIGIKLDRTDFALVKMLWEKYYAYPEIVYVNILKSEEEVLLTGIQNDCYWSYEMNQFYIQHRRYVRVPASEVDSSLPPDTFCYRGVNLFGQFNYKYFEPHEIDRVGDRIFVDDHTDPDAMEYYQKCKEQNDINN